MLNKIKRNIIIILLLFSVCLASTPLNSLKEKVEKADNAKKLELIVNFFDKHQSNNSIKAMNYLNEGIKLARQLKKNDDEIYLLMLKAIDFEIRENYEEAMKIYIKLKNNYTINSISNKAYINYAMGGIYHTWGDYPNALKSTLKALEQYEMIPDETNISNCFNNLGNIYSDNNKNNLALNYYKKALKIYEKNNNTSGIATISFNTALLLTDLKKYDEAIENLIKTKKIYKKLQVKDGIVDCFNAIGEILLEQNKIKEALINFNEAYSISKKFDIKYGVANSLENIGLIKSKENKFKEATELLSQSLKLYKEMKLNTEIADLYLTISEVYQKMGKYQKAFTYHQKHHALHQKIFNENNRNKLAEFQTRHEIDKQLQEIKALKQNNKLQAVKLENKNNKNIFFTIITILGLLFVIVLSNRLRMIKKLHRQSSIQEKELEKLYSEQKNAQNEIINLEKKNSVLAMIVTTNHELNQPLTAVKGYLYMLEKSFVKETLSKLQNKTIIKMNSSVAKIEAILKKYREIDNIKFDSYTENSNIQMVVIPDKEDIDNKK